MPRTISRRRWATCARASCRTWRSTRQARIAGVRNPPTAFRSSHRRPATSPSRRASSRSTLQSCSTSSIPPESSSRSIVRESPLTEDLSEDLLEELPRHLTHLGSVLPALDRGLQAVHPLLAEG